MSEEIISEAKSNSTKPLCQRNIENLILIWLDSNLDHDGIVRVRHMVDTVHTFTDSDQCIDFITNMKNARAFLVIANPVHQTIIPLIHHIDHLDSIYLFSENELTLYHSMEKWFKVKGIFSAITPLREALAKIVRKCDEHLISISFITDTEDISNRNLNELDQSFMYTQLLKEILLEIEFDKNVVENLVKYCREQLIDTDKFEQEYNLQTPIWWYTAPIFLYSMLNRALRLQQVGTIIKMGFFIQDLHRQIEQLHSEQTASSSTVYRGQAMSLTDFDKMMATKGGLMSFNNFLSTSKDQDLSLMRAESNASNQDMVGILFEINTDTSIHTAPFANVESVSYFRHQESEILFSMHTVFRIVEIKELDKSNRLWQVKLKMTNDNDPLLTLLTERMRHEIQGLTGWHRLGHLLLKLGQSDKAEDVYQALLDQKTSDDSDRAHIYHQLGYVKDNQGDFDTAISFYHKALEIDQKVFPPNHPELATSYQSIGLVYYHMGDYAKALSFYEKDLEITKQISSPDQMNLAICYNNIGSVYDNMGDYAKALLYYEKALELKEKFLPPNHPSLCTSYNNIGLMYDNLGEYAKALSYHKKALIIREKTLPPDHPDLATSYNNMGLAYNSLGEYSKVLPFYQKALEIKLKLLPANHPSLNTTYNNIGSAYKNLGKYTQALSSYRKALDICQNALPPNHPDYAYCYNNMGTAYDLMNECSQALAFYEKALKIRQEVLPPNHVDLAFSYNNIARIYRKMGEYSRALPVCERALEIFQCSLPANHPHIQTMKEGIELLKKKL